MIILKQRTVAFFKYRKNNDLLQRKWKQLLRLTKIKNTLN
jgi:hypothetical protein